MMQCTHVSWYLEWHQHQYNLCGLQTTRKIPLFALEHVMSLTHVWSLRLIRTSFGEMANDRQTTFLSSVTFIMLLQVSIYSTSLYCCWFLTLQIIMCFVLQCSLFEFAIFRSMMIYRLLTLSCPAAIEALYWKTWCSKILYCKVGLRVSSNS